MGYIIDAVCHSQGQARLDPPDRTRLSDPCSKLGLEVMGQDKLIWEENEQYGVTWA